MAYVVARFELSKIIGKRKSYMYVFHFALGERKKDTHMIGEYHAAEGKAPTE